VTEEQFPCSNCSYDIEKEKIKNLKELIEENLGVVPVWYRAARFGADVDTIKILSELNFKYDSSFTPGIDWSNKGGPDFSNQKNGKRIIDPYDIVEYPITILGKRFGLLGKILPDNWLFYRWLRPTHMTYFEEKRLVRVLRKQQTNDIVMMFHSMEIMINKTPYVRSKWMQKYFLWRLERTLNYIKKMGYKSYSLEAGE
jgi:hypothetical protein